MKLIVEIKTGRAGTRTFTQVEGEPANATERQIYDCLHAAVNVGLDNAGEILNAQREARAIQQVAAKMTGEVVAFNQQEMKP